MNLEVYIIKQGSAESRLLSRAGFDRKSLPVDEWKGRRRSRGGFGKAPVAWRIEGEDDIRKLCESIELLLGRKSDAEITAKEASALSRAKRTLAAFDNRSKRQDQVEIVSTNRNSTIESYFSRRFPSASHDDARLVANTLSQGALESIQEFETKADEILGGKVSGWRNATHVFVEASKM